MKKLFVLLLTCLLFVCCLSACNQAPTKVVKKNGQYYLKLNEKVISERKISADTSGMAQKITFDTWDDLIQKIRSGDFTDHELSMILGFNFKQQGMVKLFDLDHLYQPYHPDGIADYSVEWYGSSHYEFHDIQTTYAFASFTIIPLKKSTFENNLPDLKEKSIDFPREEWASYVYDTELNGHTYRVMENWNYDKLNRVTFYVAKDDQYYTINIVIHRERPTDEWISQFELIPYTPPAMPLWQKIAIGAGVAVVVAGIISAGILLRKRSLRRKYAYFDIEI
jgi:hypothetical protein